jgi:Las17-binding protein actin regulator
VVEHERNDPLAGGVSWRHLLGSDKGRFWRLIRDEVPGAEVYLANLGFRGKSEKRNIMVVACFPALRAGIGAMESGQFRAGAELNSALIKQDDDSTRELYRRAVSFRDIVRGTVATPPEAQALVDEIGKDFSEVPASR